MKKVVKISLYVFLGIAILGLFIATIFFAVSYKEYSDVKFNSEALTDASLTIPIFDIYNKPIKDDNRMSKNYIPLELIPTHVQQAFISIEDKTFYQHNGINLKRMAGAALQNVKSGSLKQGASTISQQLIKNTHLTSEKTFSRKLKEIALTKKLEAAFTKDEILEFYLNLIYFGNNCYGIENASSYYFSKSASKLTLSEGALLAGIIKSPRNYCPINKPENAKKRRNLVLTEMHNDEKVDGAICENAKSEEIVLDVNIKLNNKLNSYSEAVLDEAIRLLDMPAKQIALGQYKIYTYQNPEKQEVLSASLKNQSFDCNYAGIVIDPKTFAISAYEGKSDYKILNAKRQPGSTIKPLLVYGPALNENIISPATQILDEPIDISGYRPKNVGGSYSGYISCRDALSKSVNIPAIKTLSYVGIDKAKNYAENMGITFDENDNSYALALGGMTYGVNLKDLTGAYATFINGEYSESKFIAYIQNKNGKIIYKHTPDHKIVLRKDSAYLLTDMLKTSTKSGTSRKLSNLDFDIAGKTGTVQKPKTNENLDAYSISYTTDNLVGIWAGNLDNTPITVAGGNKPTAVAKEFYQAIYKNEPPKPFIKPSSVLEKEIDVLELEQNHTVSLANDFIPERYRKSEIFSSFFVPKTSSSAYEKVTPAILSGYVEDNFAVLEFDSLSYMEYDLMLEGNKDVLIKHFDGENGKVSIEHEMKDRKETYYLVTKIKNHVTGKITEGEKIKVILFNKNIT